VMLYKIEPGASDQSLGMYCFIEQVHACTLTLPASLALAGIHVARLARFPDVVVADAAAKAAQLAVGCV
jgi:DNA mismatch repair ATPase MutS